MKTFFGDWRQNFKSSYVLALLVILAVNAGGLAVEDGAEELAFAIAQYGVFLTIVLFVFSIALNTFILTSLVSFIYTLIDRLKKK